MKRKNFTLADITVKILRIGLPIILTYFIYLICALTSHKDVSKDVIIHVYSPQLEYIMASLAILIIGAILIDITAKEIESKK